MKPYWHKPRLLLNLDYLHANYVSAGFGDILRDVLHAFHGQATENLQTILEAYARGDFIVVAETAHTLKGSAGSVGALRLAEGAEELEDAAEQGNLTAVGQLIHELSGLVSGTLTAVTTILAQPQDERWPTAF